MRVLVTGAAGHIASAVVPELLASGHEVVGLARTDAAAATLRQCGVTVRRGDLDDVDGLKAAAASADGVIHLAFKHDEMRSGNLAGAAAADLAAMLALGDALADTDKPLVTASATLLFATLGRRATEDDAAPHAPRGDAENAVIGFAERGVRSSIVRIPPITHSTLDRHGSRAFSSRSRAGRASLATPVTERIAGRPDTRSTSVISSAWRSRRRRPVRGFMPSETRAFRRVRSRRASAITWACNREYSSRPAESAFRFSRDAYCARQSDVERRHTARAWMGADASWTDLRLRPRELLQKVNADVAVH